MRNGVTEQELAESATGERVTLANIDAAIASEHYFTAAEGELGHRFTNNEDVFGVPNDLELLMFCVLVLWNGFTVVGQSACADPANFNEDIGRRIAKQDAVNKIWPLMGFALKSKMANEQLMVDGKAFSGGSLPTFIGTKVVHAKSMDRLAYNELRGWTLPADENGADEGYLVEYTDRVENPPHVQGYEGYISWSPKEVFERAYRPARITSAQPKVNSAKGAEEARLDTMEQLTTIGELRINTNPNNPTVLYFLKVTVNGQKFGHFLEVSKEELAAGTEVETQIVGKLLTVMGHGVLTGEWETPAIEPKKEDCASRLNRMKQELEEVSTRFKKLDDFLLGDSFASLPANDRQDLCSQHRFMEGYVGVLSRRVAKAGYSA